MQIKAAFDKLNSTNDKNIYIYRTLLDRNYGNLCNNLKKSHKVKPASEPTNSVTKILCFRKEIKFRGRKNFEWNTRLSSSLCNFSSLGVCVMQVDGESLSVHKQHCVTNWREAGRRLLFAFGVQHLHEKSLSGRTASAVFLVQVVFTPARNSVHFR